MEDTATETTEGQSTAVETEAESPSTSKETSEPSEVDPEKFSELLKQVSELTGKISTLSKENEGYKAKEIESQRATQSREETLEQDLTEAQQTIHQMDQVIRYTAVINAIQSNPDLEFHSAKHVMRELDMEAFDLDVDLESGTATVNGIDNELKRIARDCEWLVKRNGRVSGGGAGEQAKPKVRSSGAPPAPPGANGAKANRRQDLSKRFPVIMHNRSV